MKFQAGEVNIMATVESSAEGLANAQAVRRVPVLCAGDRLTRAEFERRYSAMKNGKKAELIEGVVYMPSPVSHDSHGRPHIMLTTWLGSYWYATPGTDAGDNSTLRLDWDNEPQPDAMLRIFPQCGGKTRDEDEYIGGAPELIAEVSASSVSYDLHDKLRVYQRNGVCEYLVWRVSDSAIDWFSLREGRFERLPLSDTGQYHSETFPGLWLDPGALVRLDFAQVMAVLQQGLASPEHAAFVERLQTASARSKSL
jgi:Uma2 family endonuclease